MPSLSDIANSILNALNAIQTNTANTDTDVLQVKADTAALNLKMNTLIGINQAGFINLSQGIAAMILQQFSTNQQLQFQTRQNETIICWLKNIANVLCDIKRIVAEMEEDGDQMRALVARLEQIIELVHGSEAVQVHAHEALQERIEKCCPDKPVEPKPCFPVCEEPVRPPEVPRPNFTPLGRPDQPGTNNPSNPNG